MDIQLLAIGADHAGAPMKRQLMAQLAQAGYTVQDQGADGQERVDYPDYGANVARLVSDQAVDAGILVCGTGIGMSIVANKFSGVRAALVHDTFTAQMAREHNNANILVLGGRLMATEYAWECVRVWLEGHFEDRHQTRIDKIHALEDPVTR